MDDFEGFGSAAVHPCVGERSLGSVALRPREGRSPGAQDVRCCHRAKVGNEAVQRLVGNWDAIHVHDGPHESSIPEQG